MSTCIQCPSDDGRDSVICALAPNFLHWILRQIVASERIVLMVDTRGKRGGVIPGAEVSLVLGYLFRARAR